MTKSRTKLLSTNYEINRELKPYLRTILIASRNEIVFTNYTFFLHCTWLLIALPNLGPKTLYRSQDARDRTLHALHKKQASNYNSCRKPLVIARCNPTKRSDRAATPRRKLHEMKRRGIVPSS